MDTREVVGELGDPPRIEVQAQGTGSDGGHARTSSYFGLGEAVVYGTLVDPSDD